MTAVSEPNRCVRCVLDSRVPGIEFSKEGLCSHCQLFERLETSYRVEEQTGARLQRLLRRMKARGKRSKYDCVMGLSGGTDSSYCLYMAKKLGLRPLAVHFDNGWVSEPAKANIEKVVNALQLDMRVVRRDWSEMREYYLAGLKASVPDICICCMVGIASSLYQVAAEENIGYVLLGTSFKTEGMTPARWGYVDGTYFNDLVERYAKIPPAQKDFNRICLSHLFYYVGVRGIKTVQLPLYIPYRDNEIRQTLEREIGWTYGGHHHFDCRFKPFVSHVHGRKFGIDLRIIPLSALVRSGEISREEALQKLETNANKDDQADLQYCLDRLGLDPREFEMIFLDNPKNFLDYRNYYKRLKMFGGLAKLLGRLHLIPETAYERYFKLV